MQGLVDACGRRRRPPAADGGGQWLPFKTTEFAVRLVWRWSRIRPYLCAQIQRGSTPAWTTRALGMDGSACAQCSACSVLHARLAMLFCCMHCYGCMARACMHIVLRRSADACSIVPILADHRGGAARCHAVRVVRAGLPLRPRRPSGHSREHEEAREGTAKEGEVARVEQFPRGGGLSSACSVLCMCRPAMHPGRVSMLHSSLAPAWLLSRGSQELGRSTALLRLHACVRFLVYFG